MFSINVQVTSRISTIRRYTLLHPVGKSTGGDESNLKIMFIVSRFIMKVSIKDLMHYW